MEGPFRKSSFGPEFACADESAFAHIPTTRAHPPPLRLLLERGYKVREETVRAWEIRFAQLLCVREIGHHVSRPIVRAFGDPPS